MDLHSNHSSNTSNDQADSIYSMDSFFAETAPMSKESLNEYEQDYVYMKSLYPLIVREIQQEVEEQCDLLEHAGSCMFDQYPDKVHLSTIVNTIYIKMQTFDKEDVELQAQELSCNPLSTMCYRKHSGFASPPPPPMSDFNQYGRPLWLHSLIEVMLYSELLYRRRRYNCYNCE